MQTKAEMAAYRKAYREANKEHLAAYKKAWREANPEKEAASSKAYREENKEKLAASNKAWNAANKEKKAANNKAWYAANKEKKAALNKAYKADNRGAVNATDAKRRAAKLERTPPWSDSEFEKFAIKEAYICSQEREAATGVRYQVDHIIPLQGVMVSGLHVAANLQVITAKENGEKSNKFNIEEFNNEERACG